MHGHRHERDRGENEGCEIEREIREDYFLKKIMKKRGQEEQN